MRRTLGTQWEVVTIGYVNYSRVFSAFQGVLTKSWISYNPGSNAGKPFLWGSETN